MGGFEVVVSVMRPSIWQNDRSLACSRNYSESPALVKNERSSTMKVWQLVLPARDRLLESASELFYRDGIHSIGVDRIVGTAGIHAGDLLPPLRRQEALVEAYLDREDEIIRGMFAQAATLTEDPSRMLELLIAGLAEDIATRHTRGLPVHQRLSGILRTRSSAVRQKVRAHRAWFRSARGIAHRIWNSDLKAAAAELVLLRDAAMVGGYLDGPQEVGPTFTAAGGTRRVRLSVGSRASCSSYLKPTEGAPCATYC